MIQCERSRGMMSVRRFCIVWAAACVVFPALILGQALAGKDDPDAKWDEVPRILDVQPYILNLKSVRKELKITPEQHEEFLRIDRELRDSEEETITRLQKTTKAMFEAVPRILKPEQIKRFKQVGRQMLGVLDESPGVGALIYPGIQGTLKLSDEQKARIKEIDEEAQKENEEAGKNGRSTDTEMQIRRPIHKTAMEKLCEF